MSPKEFEQWRLQQRGRPVATSAKTFVAADGNVTAVVLRIPNMAAESLAIASRALIDVAQRTRSEREGWTYPESARDSTD